MSENKESVDIVDIYEGNLISAWHDHADLFLGFPACTVFVPIDRVDETMDELCDLVHAWQDYRKRDASKN
jgi:hypothetical protein